MAEEAIPVMVAEAAMEVVKDFIYDDVIAAAWEQAIMF